MRCRDVGLLRFLERWNGVRASGLRRAIERLDDPNVLHALLARWLGLTVAQNTVGEVHEFRRELVSLPTRLCRRSAINRESVLEPFRILVRGVGVEVALVPTMR